MPMCDFLRAKGCNVTLVAKSKSIRTEPNYLIVVNVDGSFQNDKTLRAKITSIRPKTVVINSAKNTHGLSISGALLKQIFVDNIIPGYGTVVDDIRRKALAPIVSLPRDGWFAVAGSTELFEKVVTLMFSFPEEKAFLFGKLYSYHEFVNEIKPGAIIRIDPHASSRLPRGDIRIEESKISLAELSKHVSLQPVKNKQRRLKFPKYKTHVGLFPYLVLVAFIAVVAPYLMLLTSAGMSYLSYKSLSSGNFVTAGKLVGASKTLSRGADSVLSRLSWPLSKTANSLDNVNLVFTKVVSIAVLAKDLSLNMTDLETVEHVSRRLSLDLDSLYRDMLIYGDDLNYMSKSTGINMNFDEYSNYVLAASKTVDRLPELLGYDSAKTYLVLLQNNMELRPTGGFIGSFALVTFSSGEMVDDTIYDVYSADGQLKGYIEPPKPILEHLGEASWKMRDSNWDPDFPTSAKRAEWFLDKSLDREVEGVVALNLESVKEYLDILGPIYLSSFGETISSRNMYEKVQYEVEENFFPGSRKKAQYLSALSEAMLVRLSEVVPQMPLALLKATSKSILARDIQIYMHDKKLAEVFSDLGWDGGVFEGSCEEGCLYLPSGVVEANVGVNKANYFVSRKAKVGIQAREEYIEEEVSLTLTNKAQNVDRIPEQRYKAYVRALAPKDSQFLSAKIVESEATVWVDVDSEILSNRKEYGLVVEVLPKEEKTVVFKWRVPVPRDLTKIKFDWWKQSGVGEYPFSMSVSVPRAKEFSSNPPLGLTKEGDFGYNTNLSSDFVSEFVWKNE